MGIIEVRDIMPRTSIYSCIVVGLLLCLTRTPANGQGLQGMQIFAPVDSSNFDGEGTKANEGFFFSFDGLYWSIGAPEKTTIGKEGLTRTVYYTYWGTSTGVASRTEIQHNALDTSNLSAQFTGGDRIEFGRVTDNQGWLFSITQLMNQKQDFSAQGVSMVFDDAEYGTPPYHHLDGVVSYNGTTNPGKIEPLPLTFSNMTVHNEVSMWGLEWMYVGRSDQLAHGGYFEWFAGPRYMEFDDSFRVRGRGGILDESYWINDANNHIIAGQLGAHWFKKAGRWELSAEGRFFAGLNCQTAHLYGELGSNLATNMGAYNYPQSMSPATFSHSKNFQEFTPGVELRLEAKYQLSRSISFKAGWSGMWMDGIARGANMIDYSLTETDTMPINEANNRQGVFVNGLTVGVELNR